MFAPCGTPSHHDGGTYCVSVIADAAAIAWMEGAMFVVGEAEAAVIRAAFEQRGELSAVVELRRLFPGVTDNAQARECARTIAGWKPLSALPLRRVKLHPKK